MREPTFYLIYNLVTRFFLLPVLLFHALQKLRGDRPPAVSQRLGKIPKTELQKIKGRPVIWVHAVSVGETLAAKPLLVALKERFPDHALLVSSSTSTGREISSRLDIIDLNICFPFDFRYAVQRTLKAVQPKIVIIMETEIWPNFVREASRLSIPILIANGRISDRSLPRYQKFRWAFRPALQLLSAICTQSTLDAERFIAIGAKADACLPIGNLKCDIPYREVPPGEKSALRAAYALPESCTVITAGSTRPGEEEYLVEAYKELLSTCQKLFLVLVPRHPERAGEVTCLLDKKGLRYRRRSEIRSTDKPSEVGEVLLVDTIGELIEMYSLADLVFVGGSLAPFGGHNLLEPASLARPSVFGPHMDNFRDIRTLVLRYNAGVQVAAPQDLALTFSTLIADREKCHLLGQNALKMMQENGGATSRHLDVIAKYLDVP